MRNDVANASHTSSAENTPANFVYEVNECNS